MSQQQQEIDLYFFSQINQQYLICVSNSAYCLWSDEDFMKKLSNHQIQQCLKFNIPQSYLGKEYQKLFIPCVPAQDIYLRIHQNDWGKCIEQKNYNQQFDIQMGALLKVSQQTNILGYSSGHRSCIIKNQMNNKFYRLKGCGNDNKGFTVQKNITQDPESLEIRGAHYFHTAKRELYLTDFIGRILKEHNIYCGNKSTGFWEYSSDGLEIISKKFNINDNKPSLKKYCCVFETLGEKRLATHLLQGIEILISCLIKFYIKEQDKNKLKVEQNLILQHFVQLNRYQVGNKEIDYAFCELSQKSNKQTLKEYYKEMQKQNCGFTENEFKLFTIKELNNQNILGNDFNNILLSSKDPSSDKGKEIRQMLMQSFKLQQQYENLFENLLQSVIYDNKQIELLQLLHIIFSRIGWEVGRIKRIFIDNDLNWGCFIDHHPYLPHCNAHPNNFIVLQIHEQTFYNLLAALDFDLAFTKDEFINIDIESPNYGKNDQELFEELLKQEKFNFELSLTGMENMQNFQYQQFQQIEENIDDHLFQNSIKTILRDTLKYYYIEGFCYKQYQNLELYKSFYEKINQLVCISLIITQEFQN